MLDFELSHHFENSAEANVKILVILFAQISSTFLHREEKVK